MEVRVRVERYADQGRCVGHVDGQVVFVRFALPGELVDVLLDEPHDRRDRFRTGEVVRVLEPSPDRVDPVWPLAGPLAWGGGLGGADLVHVNLSGQLAWKADVIAQQMERLGGVRTPIPIDRPEGDLARSGLNWRTRIDLVADGQGRPSMRRRASHDRVPLTTMPLATRDLLDLADRYGIWEGGFRPGSRIRLAVPAAEGGAGDDFAILEDGHVRQGVPKVREEVAVGGRTYSYRVDASGFWQVHCQAPSLLVSAVLSQAGPSAGRDRPPVVWDLYSGSGLFTLPLADRVTTPRRVLAVEGSARAVRAARRNLEAAGLSDVCLRQGDVGRILAKGLPRRLARPDLVLLDPPRAGAKAAVCGQIAQAGAGRIIYVACDPTSLARDTRTLSDLGYRLDWIHAYDIYPMTHHVETIAVFTRTRESR